MKQIDWGTGSLSVNEAVAKLQQARREDASANESNTPTTEKQRARPNQAEIDRVSRERDDVRAELDRRDRERIAEAERAGDYGEVARYERERHDNLLRSAISPKARELAEKMGLIDVDDLKHLDMTGIRIDDRGEVKGAEQALEQLRKSRPHYFKAAASLPGVSSRRNLSRPGPAESHEGVDYAKMSDAEFRRATKSRYGINI